MRETHKYKKFVYLSDTKTGELDIIHNKPKPEFLYKYYGISEYSIDALINGYFYSSHPIELNDHLDSSNFLIGASKPLSFERYKSLFEGVYDSEEELRSFHKEDNKGIEGFYSQGFIAAFWATMSNIFGIISMTSQDKSNLMWPHYTEEKGIQIKFNTLALEKSLKEKIKPDECFGTFPMNYTKKLNPIDISDFHNFYIPFLYLTNVKSKSWKYEDEWRFIISKKNMGIPYSKSGLDPRPDVTAPKENRKAYYNRDLVQELTLGNNFFTSREFNMERGKNDGFTIEPIDNKWNSKNHIALLEYMEENLKDKIFYSGKTFKIDHDNTPYLKRTKERLIIERQEKNKYSFIRTKEFY